MLLAELNWPEAFVYSVAIFCTLIWTLSSSAKSKTEQPKNDTDLMAYGHDHLTHPKDKEYK